MKYEFDKIEKKWQDKWAEAKIFEEIGRAHV